MERVHLTCTSGDLEITIEKPSMPCTCSQDYRILRFNCRHIVNISESMGFHVDKLDLLSSANELKCFEETRKGSVRIGDTGGEFLMTVENLDNAGHAFCRIECDFYWDHDQSSKKFKDGVELTFELDSEYLTQDLKRLIDAFVSA